MSTPQTGTFRRGQRLPVLPLRAPTGETFDLAAWRGRNSLLLVLAAEGERAALLLHDLALRHADFKEEETRILGVLHGPEEAAQTVAGQRGLPFPLLPDPDAAVHRALEAADSSGAYPAVFITDRYGEIYAAWAGPDAEIPAAGELLEWARFINIQCEECFPPEWPAV